MAIYGREKNGCKCMRFKIVHQGCRLNWAELEHIAEELERHGWRRSEDAPDVVIVGSCAVTAEAERECRYIVRKMRRRHPQARIVVTGCYATKDSEKLKEAGADLTVPNRQKAQLAERLLNRLSGANGTMPDDGGGTQDGTLWAWTSAGRTRQYLKVQDGCDYNCAFCIVPALRGRSRSPSLEELLRKVEQMCAEGAKEIVLTGVNVGDAGKVNGSRQWRLYELLQALAVLHPSARIRISSVEPNLLTDEIIELIAENEDVFCPHFHLPLQAGTNRLLRKMGRRYTVEHFCERVERIHRLIPHACIGTDVIVGLPTETEKDFLELRSLVTSLPISYLHVFPYSVREGTRAASLPSPPPHVKKQRVAELLEIDRRLRFVFVSLQLSSIRPAIIESKLVENKLTATTDNYIKVLLRNATPEDAGTSTRVHLEKIVWLRGRPVCEGSVVRA